VPIDKTLALVIRTVDFSESSRVVTLYTRELGKVGALAKGAKRLRSQFLCALDLLCLSRIVLIRKRAEILDLLTEAQLERGFAPRRDNLDVLLAGHVVAELLSALTEQYDPHPKLFDLSVQTLGDLERGGPIGLLLRRYELAVLRLIGHGLRLDRCCKCGKEPARAKPVAFSAADGGLLCYECLSRSSRHMPITHGAVQVLRLLAKPWGRHWQRLAVNSATMAELRAVTKAAVLQLTQRPLRSWRFIEQRGL